jgi:hypothetical protein
MSNKTILTWPPVEVSPTTSTNLPTRLLTRELDIDVKNSKMEILYTRTSNVITISDRNQLNEKIKLIANNNYVFDNQDGCYETPFKSQLSIGNYQLYTIYVIKLKKDKKIQFSNIGPIISTRKEFEKYFSEPRKFDENGNIYTPSNQKNDCHGIYFFMNGLLASTEFGGNFSVPFNLHIDYVSKDSGNNNSYVPIIIDPEIRYPGGSGPTN